MNKGTFSSNFLLCLMNTARCSIFRRNISSSSILKKQLKLKTWIRNFPENLESPSSDIALQLINVWLIKIAETMKSNLLVVSHTTPGTVFLWKYFASKYIFFFQFGKSALRIAGKSENFVLLLFNNVGKASKVQTYLHQKAKFLTKKIDTTCPVNLSL